MHNYQKCTFWGSLSNIFSKLKKGELDEYLDYIKDNILLEIKCNLYVNLFNSE